MNADDLTAIEPWIGGFLQSIEPRGRRKAMDKLMRMVRRANAQRISANREPDGSAMAARRKRDGPKRGKMFKHLGKAKSLKIAITDDAGELRFASPLIESAAATHHYGLTGFVGRTRAGRVIRTRYDARRLLGFGAEADAMLDELIKHIAP